MRKFLLLFVVLIGAAAAAKTPEPSKRKPAQVDSKSKLAAIFQHYLGCRTDDMRSFEPLKICVAQILEPKIAPSRADRLASWLLLAPEVSLIRDCTPEELKANEFFPERTKEALCFEFKLNSVPKRGIVYFKSANGKSYLHSFDYH